MMAVGGMIFENIDAIANCRCQGVNSLSVTATDSPFSISPYLIQALVLYPSYRLGSSLALVSSPNVRKMLKKDVLELRA